MKVVFGLLGIAWVSAYMAHFFYGQEWFNGAGDITALQTGMLFMIWAEVLGKKDG